MGLRDLFFGKEEEGDENAVPPESLENPPSKDSPRNDANGPRNLENKAPFREKPAVVASPSAEVTISSTELEAEVKALKAMMDQEKKEKGLGLEYFGFLKALGDENDADAYGRTLRTLNAVREQFSVGSTLTWKMLIDSGKSCLSWLSAHANQKVTELQASRRTANANFVVQVQKAETAIQDNEAKIRQLQKEIEEQKVVRQSALDAQKKAELEFERKKTTFDSATVQLANDIATDIAKFQTEA